MDYVVLARKLRPTRFSELIGQETVSRALRNAVMSGRIAHAFLFSGSRGVGKTSTARILTKAINCQQLLEGEPCNQCTTCTEITQNASPDVYEIDAASNRGIDNIRELRDNTGYVPVNCTFKTYIIDEVHMLTMESFNALLKTLEEPPPHVKFILATTSPHRIPETILSRCQRYDFQRIPVGVMADYLSEVTGRESIEISRVALEAIARNAVGGMRDALTALDQVTSFSGNNPSDEQVWRILGLTDNREVHELLGAVLDKSLESALDSFTAVGERGHDLTILLEALITTVKDYSLYLALGRQAPYFSDHPPDTLDFFAAQEGQVTVDLLQQLFYLLLEVEQQFKRTGFRRLCFEMGLVKACGIEPLVGVPEMLEEVRRLSGEGSRPRNEARGTMPRPGNPPPERPPPRGAGRNRESVGGKAQSPAGQDSAEEGEEGAPAAPGEQSPRPGPPTPATEPLPEPPPWLEAGAHPDTPPAPPHRWSSAREDSSLSPSDAGQADPAPQEHPGEEPSPSPTMPVTEPPTEDQAAEQLAEQALCEDGRWKRLVERAEGGSRLLATKLRRMEVEAIAEQAVAVVLPDEAAQLTVEEQSALESLLAEAFGSAFHIRVNDDKNKKARHAHTIAGRNQLRERLRLDELRSQAENDENVRRLLRFFPKGKVVDISLNDPPVPGRSDDV